METNPIQFLPSRSSQSSGRDPTLIVALDPGAGKAHLQNSEKQFGAPGGRGFTEEVALDPGLERREGIRCFYRPEKRAGGGRTDRRRSERDRGTHRSPGLSQSREAPGRARRALCPPHFGERIRAAESLRLCWIPCLRQAMGGLPEPSRQHMWLLRPDSARPSTAAWGWLISWPHCAGRQRRLGAGLRA